MIKLLQKIILVTTSLAWSLFCHAAHADTFSPITSHTSYIAHTVNLNQLFHSDTSNGNAGAFSLATSPSFSDKIRFLQIFFFSNAECTNLIDPASASITDNGTGFAVQAGQTVNLNAESIYTLANNRLYADEGITPGGTGGVQCISVYADGGNVSSSGINHENFPETCNDSTKTCVSNTTQSNISWQLYTTPTFTRNLYVPDVLASTSPLYICVTAIGAPGSIPQLSCTTTPTNPFATPFGEAINNGYIYVANGGGTGNGYVLQCPVSNNGIDSGDCTEYDSGTYPFDDPEGMAVSNNYIYTVNYNNNTVTSCDAAPTTGILTDCTAGSSPEFNNPLALVVSNNHGYIANCPNSGGTSGEKADIIMCPLNANADGGMNTGSCNTAVYSASSQIFTDCIYNVTFSNGYAYVVDSTASTAGYVYVCPVTELGQINRDACTYTGPHYSASNVSLSNGYAYLLGQNGNVVECPMSSAAAGTISSNPSDCTITTTDPNSYPGPMTIY